MIMTRNINEICDELFSKYSTESQVVVKSGIEMLDRTVQIHDGDFVLISAPYSGGKTALLMSFMHEALCNGKNVDLLSFNEMNLEMVARIIAFERNLPIETMYGNPVELKRLANDVFSHEKYQNLRIIEGSYTDEEIIAHIEKSENVDLLLIDNMEFMLDSNISAEAATHVEFVVKVKELGKSKGFATIGSIRYSMPPSRCVPCHKPKIGGLREYGNLVRVVDTALFPCICSLSNSYYCNDPEDFDEEKAAIYISNREMLTARMIPAVWDSEIVRFKNYVFEINEDANIPDSFFEIDEEVRF